MTLYRCTASGVQPSGRAWSMRIHYSSTATLSTVEADWLAQVDSFWTNGSHGVETLFPTGTTVAQTKTESLAVVPVGAVDKIRATGLLFDNPALAGTSSNASLPDQNVILVSLRSITPGREGRGRFHLPAPDETLVTTGELGSTPATRVTTAANALRSGMGSAGHTEVVLTYTKTKIGSPVGSFHAVVDEETDRVIRTLRGRVKSRKAVYI